MARDLLLVTLVLGAFIAANAATVPFSYDKSGTDWLGACASGERQSPINIVMDEAVLGATKELFHVNYSAAATVAVLNKGSTIQVVPSATESHVLHLASGDYKLLQMHVHAMSEHTVNGLFAPMEAHFVHVHVDDPKKLAVVGVMLRLHRDDANSTWINQWLPSAPAASGANVTVPVSADFWSSLLQPSRGFWTYPGSLTTPECDEIVQWHVLRKSQPLSVAQTIHFMNMMAVTNNGERTDNRFPQPINGRTVYFYYPESLPK
ncbi:hypothetical protein CLOM_g16153 [Closterium sp. NIES-68]|nr:hypothetical protein CLOM_g3321 [Closterium sp. NIES-68]GJP57112.1 hypothetical protein CLOM_g16153 [Closterium sp. NIES-68]